MKYKYQAVIWVAIFLLFNLVVCGQDVDPPIRIETNLVNVNVVIRDGKGKYVKNLTKENFAVFDNGSKQDIEYFSAEDAPISFGIVYDMHPTTDERSTAVLESLREFTKGLRKKDDFFTIVFNKRGSLILDFVPTLDQIKTNLTGKYREPNALYDALYLATSKIRDRQSFKKVLLVITDSADHNSEHRFNEILEQSKTLDLQIYTVLWNEAEKWDYTDIQQTARRERRVLSDATSLDRAALEELAMRTGGTVQSPTVQNANELYQIYTQIAFDARQQYTLGFYPEEIDGKWHDLKINLNSVKNARKMTLVYRAGYQSPAKN